MILVGIARCAACGLTMVYSVAQECLEAGGEPCPGCDATTLVTTWHEAPAHLVALLEYTRTCRALNLDPEAMGEV